MVPLDERFAIMNEDKFILNSIQAACLCSCDGYGYGSGNCYGYGYGYGGGYRYENDYGNGCCIGSEDDAIALIEDEQE